MKLKNKNKKKIVLIVIISIVIAFLSVIAYSLSKENIIEIPLFKEELIEYDNDSFPYIEKYDEIGNINRDFVGYVTFDSGIIDLPVFQTSDNESYLRTDWHTYEYSVLGTIFMDYECNLDSQNLVIYGHNAFTSYDAGVDEEGNQIDNSTLMFTPLTKLIEEENYKDNKTVRLLLKDKIREYEIVSVFYVECEENENGYIYPPENMIYNTTDFPESYFEEYKTAIKEKEFYDTGVEFTNSDKYLSLQTCVEGNDLAREIVLCKEINTTELNRKVYDKYVKQQAKLEKQALKEASKN